MFLFSILLLTAFFLLPRNQKWLEDRIFPYWYDFQNQKNNLDIEHRKIKRYGSAYTYSKFIADFFDKKGIKKNVLVLIPPTAYFKKNGIDYDVPEPSVFYYYTGLKTVWINSKEAINADWFVSADSGQIIIDSSYDRNSLLDTIKAFKKFPVSL